MTTILRAPEPVPPPITADGKAGRRIEWVGEKSVMDEPYVWTGIATGRFTKEQESLLRRAALRREVRTVDTQRVIGREDIKGLSQDYCFNKRTKYICVMTYADADKLLSCADGHCFHDLDAVDVDEPAVLYPPVELRLVSEDVLRTGGRDLERVG